MASRNIPLQFTSLALLCLQPCFAEDDIPVITEGDLVLELPTVSGVSRINQLLSKAPASVTIIDRQMIEASGAQNWTDLFRLVPGMQVYSINANRFGISYHGIGQEFPNHIEVRVDGRSVYEPLFSTVNWTSLAINLEDIERVEVIRGANAPSDGSNAFLGAINIITREPIQDRGLTVQSSYGSRDTRNASARYNGSVGNLDYRWSVGYQHNSGFQDVAKSPADDGQQLRHSEFRGTYTPDAQHTLDIHLGYSNSDVGYGDADHVDEFAEVDFRQQFQSIKWQQVLDNGNELQLHLYHNRLVGDNSVPLGRLSELAVAAGLAPDVETAIALLNSFGINDGLFVSGFRHVESERYDLELTHSLNLGEGLRSVWGVGLRNEMIDAEALLEPNEKVSQTGYRLFGNLEWQPAEQWVINTGMMVEHNEIVGTIASPRLGVNYLFDDNHSLRFSAAHSQRSPSLLEANEFNVDRIDGQLLTAIRRADDDLSEEKLNSYDIGYIANYPERGITLGLRLYREQIRDGLEQFTQPITTSILSDDDDIAVRGNTLSSDRQGVELQLHYRPARGTLIALQYAYADLNGQFPTPRPLVPVGELPQNFQPLSRTTPRHIGGLLASRQLTANLTASTSLYYQDDVQWRGGGERHDAFTRVDAQLGYKFAFGDMNGRISLTAQNIGASYPDFNQNNQFNSRYYLRFELSLP